MIFRFMFTFDSAHCHEKFTPEKMKIIIYQQILISIRVDSTSYA